MPLLGGVAAAHEVLGPAPCREWDMTQGSDSRYVAASRRLRDILIKSMVSTDPARALRALAMTSSRLLPLVRGAARRCHGIDEINLSAGLRFISQRMPRVAHTGNNPSPRREEFIVWRTPAHEPELRTLRREESVET
jgi:hypothetical protein